MSDTTDRMRYIAKHANKHHLEYPDTFNPRTVLAMLDVIEAGHNALSAYYVDAVSPVEMASLADALARFRKVAS